MTLLARPSVVGPVAHNSNKESRMSRDYNKEDLEFYKNEIMPRNTRPEGPPRVCELDARILAGIVTGTAASFIQDYISLWGSETSLISSAILGILFAVLTK